MSYDDNIHGNPEKFGLEQVAELEYSDNDYQFDTRVVWRRLSDGQLLSDRDAGCSCPCPFEDTKLEDLQEVNSLTWLKEEIEEESKKDYSNNPNLAQEAAVFLEKIGAILEKPKSLGTSTSSKD